MDTKISKLRIKPEELQEIKSDFIKFFEQLWIRMETDKLKKDFQARGLVVCSDGEYETSITFNDVCRGKEENSDLNLTTKQTFHTMKYGPQKRYIISQTGLITVETYMRQRLEEFFFSKQMSFNFKACGVVMLFDGSSEVHLRMKNIRKMKRMDGLIDEIIILNDDEDEIVAVELPSRNVESPVSISSDEELLFDKSSSKMKTAQSTKPVFVKEENDSNNNQPGMNQNDYLKAYLSHYLSVQKQMNDSKDNIEKGFLLETPNTNCVLNSSHNNIKTDTIRSTKRESTSKENYERPKKPRMSLKVSSDDNDVYQCMLCHEMVTGKENYIHHSKKIHGKVPCCICGRTYTQKGNMERHLNSHLGKKLFNCDECNSSYTRFESLKAHRDKHHLK